MGALGFIALRKIQQIQGALEVAEKVDALSDWRGALAPRRSVAE
jgi:hypothetical protein